MQRPAPGWPLAPLSPELPQLSLGDEKSSYHIHAGRSSGLSSESFRRKVLEGLTCRPTMEHCPKAPKAQVD